MSAPLPDEQRLPHSSRLNPRRVDYQQICDLHLVALNTGQPIYRDPASGYDVFTAQYLWERGYCCDSGCRHCPYLEREG